MSLKRRPVTASVHETCKCVYWSFRPSSREWRMKRVRTSDRHKVRLSAGCKSKGRLNRRNN